MTQKKGQSPSGKPNLQVRGTVSAKDWAKIIAILAQYLKIWTARKDKMQKPYRKALRAARASYLALVALAGTDGEGKAQTLHNKNLAVLKIARAKYKPIRARWLDASAQYARAQKSAREWTGQVNVLDLPVYDANGKFRPLDGTTSIRAREKKTRLGDVAYATVQGLTTQTTSLTHLRLSSIRTVAKTLGQYANAKALIGHQLRPIESLGLASASPLLFWQIGELHRRLLSAQKNKKGFISRAEYEKVWGYPIRPGKALKVLGQCRALMGGTDYYIEQIDIIASAIGRKDIPPQMTIAEIYSFDEIKILTGVTPDGIGGAQKVMRQYRARAKKINGEEYISAPVPQSPYWVASQSKVEWAPGLSWAQCQKGQKKAPGPMGPMGPFVVPVRKAHASAPRLGACDARGRAITVPIGGRGNVPENGHLSDGPLSPAIRADWLRGT